MTDGGKYRPSIQETFPGLFSAASWTNEPPVNYRRFCELVHARVLGVVIVQCGEEQYNYQINLEGQRKALVLSEPCMSPSGGLIYPAERIIFY